MNKKNTRKGFTIVELVIVIAVIAILATVLVPTFGTVIQDAQKTALMQELKNEYTAYAVDQKTGGTIVIKLNEKFYSVADGKPDTTELTEEQTKYWDAATNKMMHKFEDAVIGETNAGDGKCDTCGKVDGVIEHYNHTQVGDAEKCTLCGEKHAQ